MTDMITVLANVSVLVFVVTSMLALVVAAQNLYPNVLVMILVGALLMPASRLPLGGELGKRRSALAPAGAGEDIDQT